MQIIWFITNVGLQLTINNKNCFNLREIGCHLACHHDCQHKVSKNCGVDEKGMREILSNLKPIDDVNLFLIFNLCVLLYVEL